MPLNKIKIVIKMKIKLNNYYRAKNLKKSKSRKWKQIKKMFNSPNQIKKVKIMNKSNKKQK